MPNVTDIVVGSQTILIIVSNSSDKYKNYIEFEYKHGHYIVKVKK